MREFKFRAWDKINCRFTKPENLLNPNIMSIKLTENGFRFPNTIESTFIYQQYTGLKDKNGKEIYEGDILMFNCRNYIVEWNNDDCCFDPLNEYLLSSDCEVIGNIHENPELLK